jgi:uncharacterized protein (TIGR02246 family)
MIRSILIAALMFFMPGLAAAQPSGRAADEAAITAIVQRMESAWNAHDMKAYSGQFHDDAAFITFQGDYLKGRQAIYDILAKGHATEFRNSVTSRRVEDISFVGPDAAVVHVYRTNSGIADKPVPSRNTLVVTRRGGKWGIHAFQNTRLMERKTD